MKTINDMNYGYNDKGNLLPVTHSCMTKMFKLRDIMTSDCKGLKCVRMQQ
jgi:hypothetical protein